LPAPLPAPLPAGVEPALARPFFVAPPPAGEDALGFPTSADRAVPFVREERDEC